MNPRRGASKAFLRALAKARQDDRAREAKPRRGRPPLGDKAATERIEIRVTRLERAAWEHAAAQAGMTLSEWIRQRCLIGAAIQRTEVDGKVTV